MKNNAKSIIAKIKEPIKIIRTKNKGKKIARITLYFNGINGLLRTFNWDVFTRMKMAIKRKRYSAIFCHKTSSIIVMAYF